MRYDWAEWQGWDEGDEYEFEEAEEPEEDQDVSSEDSVPDFQEAEVGKGLRRSTDTKVDAIRKRR